VTVSTAACSLATLAILFMYHREQVSAWPEPVHAMGWWPVGVTPALQSVFLVMILYTGPLFETLVVDGLWTDCLSPSRLRQLWEDWPTWRNLVAVGIFIFFSLIKPLKNTRASKLTQGHP
jgi:prenyl protein peptidase